MRRYNDDMEKGMLDVCLSREIVEVIGVFNIVLGIVISEPSNLQPSIKKKKTSLIFMLICIILIAVYVIYNILY